MNMRNTLPNYGFPPQGMMPGGIPIDARGLNPYPYPPHMYSYPPQVYSFGNGSAVAAPTVLAPPNQMGVPPDPNSAAALYSVYGGPGVAMPPPPSPGVWPAGSLRPRDGRKRGWRQRKPAGDRGWLIARSSAVAIGGRPPPRLGARDFW